MIEWCPHCQAFKKTEEREDATDDIAMQERIFTIETTCYACNNTIRVKTKSVKYRELITLGH